MAQLQSIQKVITGVASIGWKLLPDDAKHVLFGPRRRQTLLGDSPASEAASIVGRDAARTVAATQTLKNLLCHSLTEDPYGSVQKDIRRILIAMVELDIEIRRFGLELDQRAIAIDEKLNKLEAAASRAMPPGRARSKTFKRVHKKPEADGLPAAIEGGVEGEWCAYVDGSLTASIREILDTFARFDLPLGDELEVKLADCLS